MDTKRRQLNMKRTKEEFMEQLKKVLGDNTSDDALALIEDASDSFEGKSKEDADWEKKYNDTKAELEKKIAETDAEWRKKYKERFFSSEPSPEEKKKESETDKEVLEKEHAENVSIDDLFTSKGE